MTNTPQDLYIYAIIRKRLYDLLKPEIIDYFTGYQRKLLEACFMIRMRKGQPTTDLVKNYLYMDKELPDRDRKAIIAHLDNIVQDEHYIDAIALEKAVENQYYTQHFAKLGNMLGTNSATMEMKKQMVAEVAETIKKTRKQDDWKNIKDILKEHRKIEAADERKSLLKIEDEYLKLIFDDTIYPHMYSILARPNDYKTTLLFNLLAEFNKLNYPGILISLEDSSTMAAIKFMALQTGLNKKDLIQCKYDKSIYDSGMEKLKGNIYVLDKMRTADEIYMDLHNKMSICNVSWIAVDYLQCVKGEKFLSEYEKVSTLDSRLFELNKEFNIPVFRLTQAPKDKIQGDGILGMGDEKSSGEIAHNSRYSISINKLDKGPAEDTPFRLVHIYKTTFRPHGKVNVEFDGPSGKIINAERY